MRDPKRIRPFLEKLGDKWEEYPDLRFGQLVTSIVSVSRQDDGWDYEDNWWEEAIEAFETVPKKY